MNSCNFTGRITNDLELRTTPNGVSVCTFTLAVKRPKAKDTTDFISFVAFRQTAEYLSKYAQKGTLIEVAGVLTSRKWEDKNGNKRISFEITTDNASILESKKQSDNKPDISCDDTTDFSEIEIDGDLPF